MGQIKDVAVKPANNIKQAVPQEGFYVKLKYTYGAAGGFKYVESGAIPMERKALFIELLNVLDAMSGKQPEDYDGIPGYGKFFEPDGDYDKPDGQLLDELGLETVYIPHGYGGLARMTGYECWYHDGQSAEKHAVVPIK